MDLTVQTIVDKLPPRECVGEKSKKIERIVSASAAAKETDLVWISEKNSSLIDVVSAGTVICGVGVERTKFRSSCTYLLVDVPRLYFLQVAKHFFLDESEPFISDRAQIHPTAVIGQKVAIEAGVVIEKNCSIGDGTRIGANTVVKRDTVIGSRVRIGANNTIGGDGFGYEMNEQRQFEFIPHLGNVVIEDDVEIGNNTTIDRAVLGSTLLRKNVKVDNLVHIAHGVEIGENSLVIANSMIAGSSKIGKNVWVAPSASILNKLSIGDNVTIGMGAVVLKNVDDNLVIVGNPGKDISSKNAK